MANQPTKYKKFVATAATATLVASAIVPVASAASFSDVSETNSHAEAINALVEQGIIKGYEDGTFKPTATLTRGHVVKMLGKWVEAQGFEVPADWNTVARFSDLKVDAKDQELVKYAAVVKDAGVFIGSNGALNASGSITRENMALTLDRAYSAVFGQSLVEEAAGLENLTVSDLATAKAEAHEEIQALRNLEISNVDTFNPKAAVNRAQFASFLYRTINVSEEGGTTTPETGEVAITSTKATGATQLTVEFNKAVDTNAAAFELKRGNTTAKVLDVEFNEAGTVAVLKLENRFTAGTYNLSVSGVADKTLTSSLTTTAEVPTEIKFNSNTLVLNGQTSGDYNFATITFEVYNQYGEIITESVPTSKYKKVKLRGIKNDEIKVTDKGVLTAKVDKGEDEGDTGTIDLSFEDGDLEIDVTQEVVLSDEIEAGKATIVGVHSTAGYDFTAANVEKVFDKDYKNGTHTDDFVLLFNLKDQFGAEIDPNKVFDGSTEDLKATSANTASVKYITSLEQIADGLRFSVSNDDIFDIDEDFIDIVNVDGKYYFAAKMAFQFDGEYLEETGENTVSVRSKATGDDVTSKITLADSTKVYSISLSTPVDTVAGDEDIYVPVVVKDQNGEVNVNAARLNDLKRDKEITVKLDTKALVDRSTFVEKNGEVFLKLRSKSLTQADGFSEKQVEDGVDVEVNVEVENSRQESEIEFTVQENAYADRLVRLNGLSTSIYHTRSQAIGLDDIVVEDQYGRIFEDSSKLPFTIKATVKDGSIFEINGTNELSSTLDNEISLAPKAKKGSSSVEFELFDNKGASQSKLNVTFRAVEEENFVSYKVEGTDLIKGSNDSGEWDAADELKHTVKVFGITGSGDKVRLPGSAFTVISNPYLQTTSSDSTKVFINAEAKEELSDQAGTNTLQTSYTVIISKTGEVVKRDVKVTDAKRKVAKLGLEDKESLNDSALTSVDLEFTATEAGLMSFDSEDLLTELLKQATVTIADQYGFEHDESNATEKVSFHVTSTGAAVQFGQSTDTSAVAITLSNISNDDIEIKNNGRSDNLKVDKVENNDSFVLTLTVDGVSTSVLVNVMAK